MRYEGDPRAIVPDDAAEQASTPLSAEELRGQRTPLPFGVALYVVLDEGRDMRCLKLYYVPNKAANTRIGVLPGWYAVAEPGQQFEVRVTNVRPMYPRVADTTVPEVEPGREFGAEVWVDGANASGPSGYKMAKPGHEQVLSGYKTRWRQNDDGFGAKVVRPFRFKQVSSAESGGSTVEDGAGTIELRIFEGILFHGYPRDTRMHNASLHPSVTVDEKAVQKMGCAVGVERGSEEVPMTSIVADYGIEPKGRIKLGTIVVHLRQPQWLKDRRVITDNFELYKLMPRDCRTQEGRKNTTRRKQICEKVDLTGDSDCDLIDLTHLD